MYYVDPIELWYSVIRHDVQVFNMRSKADKWPAYIPRHKKK